MKYVSRTVSSAPGLSQEKALEALQTHSAFKPGTIISSIRRRSDSRWVAQLKEPKLAGPPPFGDDSAPDDGPPKKEAPSDDDSDGPPKPPGDEGGDDSEGGDPLDDLLGGPDEGGDEEGGPEEKGDIDTQILHTLTEILHALSPGGPEGMGGPDDLGPGAGGPPSPPPHPGAHPTGPVPGGPPPGRPMKPGEAPPGSTPIGAPAFASTKQAAPMMPGGAPTVPSAPGGAPVPGGSGLGGPAAGGGACPQCGYPEPCPLHGAGAAAPGVGADPGMAAVAALQQEVAKVAGRSRYITLNAPDGSPSATARIAKQAVEPYGYTVEKVKRVSGGIRIIAKHV